MSDSELTSNSTSAVVNRSEQKHKLGDTDEAFEQKKRQRYG
jgi:hypothetical protein